MGTMGIGDVLMVKGLEAPGAIALQQPVGACVMEQEEAWAWRALAQRVRGAREA